MNWRRSVALLAFLFAFVGGIRLFAGEPPKTHESTVPAKISPEYYERLSRHCMTADDRDCCLASVKLMKSRNLLEAPAGGCPSGKPGHLRCVDSYSWCESPIR